LDASAHPFSGRSQIAALFDEMVEGRTASIFDRRHKQRRSLIDG